MSWEINKGDGNDRSSFQKLGVIYTIEVLWILRVPFNSHSVYLISQTHVPDSLRTIFFRSKSVFSTKILEYLQGDE